MTFQREFDRYVVMKVSDIRNALDTKQQHELGKMLFRIENHRKAFGKERLQAVVVESDWPEYETVWDMIQGRVEAEEAERLAARGITPATLSAVGKMMDEQEVPQDPDRIDPYQAMAYAIYGRTSHDEET